VNAAPERPRLEVGIIVRLLLLAGLGGGNGDSRRGGCIIL
jgi:hypothetical protein